MGLPVNAATDTMAKNVPVRVPICCTSEICAMIAGASEMKAPEPKPYSAQKARIGALDLDGSHMASTRIDEKKVCYDHDVETAEMVGRVP